MYITAMINHVFISFSAVQIMIFHIFTCKYWQNDNVILLLHSMIQKLAVVFVKQYATVIMIQIYDGVMRIVPVYARSRNAHRGNTWIRTPANASLEYWASGNKPCPSIMFPLPENQMNISDSSLLSHSHFHLTCTGYR